MTQLRGFNRNAFRWEMQPGLLTVAPDTSAIVVIRRMSQTQSGCALVVDRQQLLGIYTTRDVIAALAGGVDLGNTPIDTLATQPVPTLNEAEVGDWFTVLHRFRHHQVGFLPVLDSHGHVRELVTPNAVWKTFNPSVLLKLKRAADVMTPQVEQAVPTESLAKITQIMATQQVGCVVLLDVASSLSHLPRLNTPVGVITEQMIVQAWARGLDLAQTTAQAMSRPVLSINPQASLQAAYDLMQHHYAQQVLVMGAAGELVGIITQVELLQVFDPSSMYEAIATLQHTLDTQAVELQLQIAPPVPSPVPSLAEMRALFAAMDDLVLVRDAQGRCTKIATPQATHILYKSADELLGQTVHEVFPYDVAETLLSCIHRALSHQQTVKAEYKLNVMDREACLDASISPIDADSVILVIRDITQRKIAEEALRYSEARLAEAQRLAQVGDWEYDLSTHCITWSEEIFRIYGQEPGNFEPTLAELLQYCHPDDRKLFRQVVEQAIASGAPYGIDFRILRSDGLVRYLEGKGEAVVDGQGQVIRLFGTVQDISDRKHNEAERKQTEAALQASEQFLRSIYDGAQTSIFVVDVIWQETLSPTYEFRYVGLNPAHERLTGIQSEVLQGKTPEQILLPAAAAAITQQYGKCIQVGTTISYEESLPFQGRETWWFTTLTPLRDEQDRIYRLIGTSIDMTSRKQAEEALQESESRFRTLVSNLPGAVYRGVYNPDWTLIFVSEAITEISGYPVSDFIHSQVRTYASIIHPDDVDYVRRVSQEFMDLRQPFVIEYRIVHADGSIRWVYDKGLDVFDDEGNLLWSDGVLFDISDRKQAEDALRQQAERERLMTEVTHRIRQSLDLVTILSTTVAEVRQFLKVDRVIIYRFNPDWSGEIIAESVASGWISLLQEQEQDPHLTNDALNHERCTVKQMGDASNQVQDTYLQDMKGGDYGLGKPYLDVDDIYTADFSECYVELLERFQVRAYITVPIFEGTKLWGLLATYQNTSPRQWQEAEISFTTNIATQLGVALQQAELLTQTLNQAAELQAAKEAADTANRAKSLFLANMSHELRTPLNAILGFTQLMANDPDTLPTQQDTLAIINRSGEYLLGLINDVLDMSKIEAGKITLAETTFDLYGLLNAMESTFQLRAGSKQLTLTFQRELNVPQFVCLDDGKLRQVLTNLLSNAIKFTEAGSVRLHVSTGPPYESMAATSHHGISQVCDSNQALFQNPYLSFEIEDTGPGIASEELVTLFNPFVQTAAGRQSQQGTGLGLSISRRLVQLMGGDIQVSSVVGQGTHFRVILPLQSTDASALQPSNPNQRIVGLAPDQSACRVLVVDDAITNRQLLVRILEPIGFEVREAGTGEEAIAIWEQWHPQLIFMDMQMPVLDGYAATQHIRLQELQGAESQRRSTVIIALTANAFAEEREKVLSIGCNDFISKPFRKRELLDEIAEYLEIRYVYAEGHNGGQSEQWERLNASPESRSLPTGGTVISGLSLALQASDLTGQPREWVLHLHEAAKQANARRILDLITQLPAYQTSLAMTLTGLVNNFRFDIIMKSTQQSLE